MQPIECKIWARGRKEKCTQKLFSKFHWGFDLCCWQQLGLSHRQASSLLLLPALFPPLYNSYEEAMISMVNHRNGENWKFDHWHCMKWNEVLYDMLMLLCWAEHVKVATGTMTIFRFCNKVPGCQKLVRHTDDEMLKSVNPRICCFSATRHMAVRTWWHILMVRP